MRHPLTQSLVSFNMEEATQTFYASWLEENPGELLPHSFSRVRLKTTRFYSGFCKHQHQCYLKVDCLHLCLHLHQCYLKVDCLHQGVVTSASIIPQGILVHLPPVARVFQSSPGLFYLQYSVQLLEVFVVCAAVCGEQAVHGAPLLFTHCPSSSVQCVCVQRCVESRQCMEHLCFSHIVPVLLFSVSVVHQCVGSRQCMEHLCFPHIVDVSSVLCSVTAV
jgi:hypothetical protein